MNLLNEYINKRHKVNNLICFAQETYIFLSSSKHNFFSDIELSTYKSSLVLLVNNISPNHYNKFDHAKSDQLVCELVIPNINARYDNDDPLIVKKYWIVSPEENLIDLIDINAEIKSITSPADVTEMFFDYFLQFYCNEMMRKIIEKNQDKNDALYEFMTNRTLHHSGLLLMQFMHQVQFRHKYLIF